MGFRVPMLPVRRVFVDSPVSGHAASKWCKSSVTSSDPDAHLKFKKKLRPRHMRHICPGLAVPHIAQVKQTRMPTALTLHSCTFCKQRTTNVYNAVATPTHGHSAVAALALGCGLRSCVFSLSSVCIHCITPSQGTRPRLTRSPRKGGKCKECKMTR